MKLLLNIFLFLIISFTAYGQRIEVIQESNVRDSSYYHLGKVSNNEFWAAGKFGVLNKIDSLGTTKAIDFPNVGLDILKVERVGKYVFVITADAVIYRYDIATETFIKKKFPSFENKCFYDLISLDNGSLLVCGGVTGIAKAKRKIPKGFIAIIDKDLQEINVVWKSNRKFVWSLLETRNQEVLAVTYNGISTSLLKSKDLITWETHTKIKGLVHEIKYVNDEVWYCGSKNVRFQKHGIVGQASRGIKRTVIKNKGCLWSMDVLDDKILTVTQSGDLLSIDQRSKKIEPITIPGANALYDIEKLSQSKILIVGQGKSTFIVDLTE